jgi:hypothetical protein
MCALVSLNWTKFPQSWKVVLLSELLDTSQHGCVDVFSICKLSDVRVGFLGHIINVNLNIRQLSCLSSAQVIPISWHLLSPFPSLIVLVVLYCHRGFICPLVFPGSSLDFQNCFADICLYMVLWLLLNAKSLFWPNLHKISLTITNQQVEDNLFRCNCTKFI